MNPDHLPTTGDPSCLCTATHSFPASLCFPYKAVSPSPSLQGCSTAYKVDLRMDRPRQLISFSFFVPVSFEFGRAVWLRFHPSAYPPCPHPSFMAHLGGVMVGITLGVIILRNYEQRLQDQTLWWIFLSIYVIFVLFAIFWNIFAYSLLDLKLPPPPWKHGTKNLRVEVICQLCYMNEDGASIFIFNLGEDDSFEHKCVLEEMLKDLTKEWADQFVHKSSRYCNTGWPGPCSFSNCQGSRWAARTWALITWFVSTHQYFVWDICIFQVSAGIMASCWMNLLNVTEH